ncbi:MAG: glycosyltransferase family 4 protein [Dehalococcoidia bacterium]
MTRIRVLIATSQYWPEIAGNAPYVTGLAEGLAVAGHRVTAVTGYPHYPQWRRQGPLRLFSHEKRNGVTVRRRWHYVPGAHSALHRLLYEATLTAGGLTAIGARRRPDAVVGVVPSLSGALLAAIAAKVYRRPLVLVFQDLMGRAAEQSGYAGGSRVARTLSRFELALARRADAVGIITPGFRQYLEAGGVSAERIHRVRNWHLGEPPKQERAETRRALGWPEDAYICLHAGNMGHKQGLSNLVEAARLLPGGAVRIVLAGDGNERERLEREASDVPGERITFLGPQAPGAYEAMLAAADVLLVNQLPAVSDMALPSKLTSYFAAGRPVVAAVAAESEAAHEVTLAGAGIVVPAGEPGQLADVLLSLHREPGKADTFGEAGRAYATRALSRDAALAEYEAMIRSAIDRTP